MPKLLIFNKPYDVLCQFTDKQGRATLSHYLHHSECKDCYPAGRLDRDSEGLMLLTDSGALQHHISHPTQKQNKYYWVQVEGVPDQHSIDTLVSGVTLNDGSAKAKKAALIDTPNLWHRNPPIRVRKDKPTSWLCIVLNEGRNRQVRRMTAAIGHPTLRLVRQQIGTWQLNSLQPGEYRIQQINLPKIR